MKEEHSGDTPAVLRFDDPEAAFSSHSNIVIMRSLAVFTICGIKPLVKYADTCLRLAKRAFGSTLVNGVVKRTFFKHFCAGEGVSQCQYLLNSQYRPQLVGLSVCV